MMRVPNSNAPLVSVDTGNIGAARQYSTTLGAPMQPGTNAVGAFNRGFADLKPITDGLADAAQAGSEIIQKKLQEEAETLADNAYANIGQDLNKHLHGENGIYSRKGVNAFNAEADTVQFFDKSLAQYGKDMNDATRKLLAARVAQLRPGIQSEVSRYEGGERREALFEANKSAMALDLDIIAKNYNNPRIAGEAWGRIDQGVEKAIQLDGMGPEQAQLYRQNADSEVLSGLVGKFLEAKEYGQAWKWLNDPRIRPASKTKLLADYNESALNEFQATAKADPQAAVEILALARERLAGMPEKEGGVGPLGEVNIKLGERLPTEVKDAVAREAKAATVDPALALAVCAAESDGKQGAISEVGARGLMQLMPSTAKELGVNPDDPAQNIKGGVAYLGQQLKKFNGDPRLALAAYNWGPGNVDAWLKTGRGVPTDKYPNGTEMPKETRDYVSKILGADIMALHPDRAVAQESLPGMAGKATPSPDDPYSGLSKPQWVAIQTTAEAALREHSHRAAVDLGERERDLTTAFQQGAAVDPAHIPTEAEYVKAFGMEEGPKRYAGLMDNKQLGDDLQLLRDTTPQQQQEMFLARGAAEPGGAGYADSVKRQAVLQQAIVQDRKAREADPAAYVLLADDSSRQLYEAMQSNPTPETTAAYARGVKVALAARGMPEDAPLLPKAQAAAIAQAFMKAEPQQSAALVMQLRDQWGGGWPAVYKQLVKDKDNPLPAAVYAIGAGMRAEPAVLLAEAAQNPNFMEQAKAAAPEARKEVDKLLPGVFAPLSDSMQAQGGMTEAARLREQCGMLAMQYVMKGLPPEDAVSKAYMEIGGGRYTFQEGYRVPLQVDAEAVHAGTEAYLKKLLTTEGALLPDLTEEWRDPKDVERLTREGVRQNARWVTDHNEEGLILYRGPFAAQRADGTPVRVTWQELTESGRERIQTKNALRFKFAKFPPKEAQQ